jgi:excisionase family DNA binding protein
MSVAADRPEVLTLRGAADLLKVHPNTVRTHARRRLIPATKVGRDWRFLEADLIAWIRSAYSDRTGLPPDPDDIGAIWHSGHVQSFAMPVSQVLAERSLDALLARPAGQRGTEDPAGTR